VRDTVPDHFDLGMFERALLHDDTGAESISAVDKIDLGCEAGQVGGLLNRRVPSPTTMSGWPRNWGRAPVAGGAVGHAEFFQRVL